MAGEPEYLCSMHCGFCRTHPTMELHWSPSACWMNWVRCACMSMRRCHNWGLRNLWLCATTSSIDSSATCSRNKPSASATTPNWPPKLAITPKMLSSTQITWWTLKLLCVWEWSLTCVSVSQRSMTLAVDALDYVRSENRIPNATFQLSSKDLMEFSMSLFDNTMSLITRKSTCAEMTPHS